MSASPEDMEPRRSRSAQVNPMRDEPDPRRPSSAAPPPPSTDGPARARRHRKLRRTHHAPGPIACRARPGAGAPRRVRHTIKKVDLWSALKISLCFYVCEMAVARDRPRVPVADRRRLRHHRQCREVHRRPAVVEGLQVPVAPRCCAARSSSGWCSSPFRSSRPSWRAAFYNLFAELFGGIEVTVIQEDAPAGKR